MQATVKCSHCGAEITNLNFSSGKRQWLWMAPLFLLIGYQFWHMYKPKGDYRKDLQIRLLETRKEVGGTVVLGTIQNSGRTTWESIEIGAEFFNAEGKFLDKESHPVSSSVEPGGTEHFKLVLQGDPDRIQAAGVRMELKIAHAFSRIF